MSEIANQYFEKIKSCDLTKPFVFVSYKRSDAWEVYPIVVKLQEAGINIWIDKELKASAGKSWQENAFNAMENRFCYKVLFFISEASMTSAAVCAEMEWSMSEQVMSAHKSAPLEIVPVNLTRKNIQMEEWIRGELLEIYQLDHPLKQEDYDCLRDVLPDELVDGKNGNKNKKIKNKFQIADYIYKKRFQSDSGITYLLPEDISSIISNLSTNDNKRPCVLQEKSLVDANTMKAEEKVDENDGNKKKSFSSTGDLTFTLYGERNTRNQSDLMILAFGKVLKANPEYIDAVTDTFTCVSNIDYSVGENRTDKMPSYYRVCHTFDILGKTVCIGTAYSFNDKMRLLAKLLTLTGDKDALKIDGYEMPEVKINKSSVSVSTSDKSDQYTYYLLHKKMIGNQSDMMWDVFEALVQNYSDKVEALTTLLAVKRAENVVNAGTKDAKPSYFRGCKGFRVNGVEYLVGTSFGKDTKITQISKMVHLCGAPSDFFFIEGTDLNFKQDKVKKSFDI